MLIPILALLILMFALVGIGMVIISRSCSFIIPVSKEYNHYCTGCQAIVYSNIFIPSAFRISVVKDKHFIIMLLLGNQNSYAPAKATNINPVDGLGCVSYQYKSCG